MNSTILSDKTAPIYLGSQSPRRQQLLTELGLKFTVLTNDDIEEVYPKRLTSREVPTYLSNLKAKHLWEDVPDGKGILITADTIVVIDEEILGKPKDRAEAQEMLLKLSGKTHAVVTGVTLKSQTKMTSFSDTTQVTFRRLTITEIDYYIDTFAPFDKAGAYGIQEWIGMIGISRISGSYFNVVGLPVEKLYRELKLM